VRLKFGTSTFDAERRQLLRGGEPVHLSPKAWRLLEVLIENRPKALSKSDLYERLWPDTFVQEANLANLVSELREAIGDDARRPLFVRTVHGFGYAFAAEPFPAEDRRAPPGDVVFRLVMGAAEIDLREGENVFGRDRHAGIWLVDESVSRRHARIVVEGERALLEDLGSKNGTFLKEARVTAPVALANGDAIRVGSVALTVRKVSTSASTVTDTGNP
jgi:DNA-binding winged helix-turn-helix (wHTH) protein